MVFEQILGNIIMIVIGLVLVYLAIWKDYEPLLLLPIGFGAILVNIVSPLGPSEIMEPGGIIRFIYDYGVRTEIFPSFIFLGIGAMVDFTPLLENPKVLLLGAAGQFGIFITLLLALTLGFPPNEASCIGIIGAMDGPTAIYMTTMYAERLIGPITVAAYSYMALVPLIQPPIIRALTSKEERLIRMPYVKRPVHKTVKILFPIAVTLITCVIAVQAIPLMGMLMLGNLMRESGVVDRLSGAAQNELNNIITLLLGITIGATMSAESFLHLETLLIYSLGFVAACLDTACGLLFGKLMNRFSAEKINPMIGASGISAFPMSARVVHAVGREEDSDNFLIMHAMATNTGGQIGSIMAATVIFLLLGLLGI